MKKAIPITYYILFAFLLIFQAIKQQQRYIDRKINSNIERDIHTLNKKRDFTKHLKSQLSGLYYFLYDFLQLSNVKIQLKLSCFINSTFTNFLNVINSPIDKIPNYQGQGSQYFNYDCNYSSNRTTKETFSNFATTYRILIEFSSLHPYIQIREKKQIPQIYSIIKIILICYRVMNQS
ncbi:transmembrane protein, putative (macronuclear) [Tetrahymena thermophila SB210]|uniref:Transmembrane protein, putative n=1 Tax=Tetrahymena thermophila (strain SB210) TaxID=312017 RepID=W7WYF2_TETTS|nr:transmembrane protein, putative [Tetrahymena thermophila SB210]EWS71895.1 transmembrane protein, putative [Tetrahymena thermophila SB210]|eukprot:XP_012655573.1 transmembrane protein, putative [Tetrahymena thermophila SB210]